MSNKTRRSHMGNRLYISPAKDSASTRFFRARNAERSINSVVRAAASPNVVPFPVYRQFKDRKKRKSANLDADDHVLITISQFVASLRAGRFRQ